MAVVVALPLFGSPDRELEEHATVTGPQLRRLGTELQERLEKAAALLDQLRAGGWSAQVGSYDLLLAHREVGTQAEAERRLREAGIDPTLFLIVEDVTEDADGRFDRDQTR